MTATRRQMLFAAGAAVFGAPALARSMAQGQGSRPKRVLFFTKSSGFQHSVITRDGDKPAHAERILTDLGKQHGFEVVASKDGRMFEPDKLADFDVIAMYTTGDLTKEGTDKQPPMSAEGEKALYDFVRSGKGLIGFHCATDTFGHHRGQGADDPYIQLIGGEFSGHGAQQKGRVELVDREFPGAGPLGPVFEIEDEWYGQKNINDDLHVVLTQLTEGMEGKDYERPNFPQTWARSEGKGRVVYTSMGHREDVWENPKFQGLVVGMLNVASGQAEADLKPNITKATPDYEKMSR